jgi:hypothetical protein
MIGWLKSSRSLKTQGKLLTNTLAMEKIPLNPVQQQRSWNSRPLSTGGGVTNGSCITIRVSVSQSIGAGVYYTQSNNITTGTGDTSISKFINRAESAGILAALIAEYIHIAKQFENVTYLCLVKARAGILGKACADAIRKCSAENRCCRDTHINTDNHPYSSIFLWPTRVKDPSPARLSDTFNTYQSLPSSSTSNGHY